MLIIKRAALLVIILYYSLTGYSADSPIDSLKNELRNTNSKKKLIDIHLKLTQNYLSESTDSSLYYVGEALELIKSIKDEKKLADAYFIKGYVNFFAEEYNLAVKYYFAALAIYQRIENFELANEILKSISDIADQHEQKELAIYYALKRIENLSTDSHYRMQANAYFDIGLIYSHHGDFILSNKYLLAAKKILDEKGDISDIKLFADLYNNFGIVQYGLSNTMDESIYLDSALYFYNRSLSLDNSKYNQGKVLNNIGNVYLRKGQLPIADSIFKHTLRIQESIGADRLSIATKNDLAMINYRKGDMKLAEMYFQKALATNISVNGLNEKMINNEARVSFIHEKEMNLSLNYLDSIALKTGNEKNELSPEFHAHLRNQLASAKLLKLTMANRIQKENFLAQKRGEELKAKAAKQERILYLTVFVGLSLLTLFFAWMAFRRKRKNYDLRAYLIDKYIKDNSKDRFLS